MREFQYIINIAKDVPDDIPWNALIIFSSVVFAVNPDPVLAHLKPESFGKRKNPYFQLNSTENLKLVEMLKNSRAVRYSVECSDEANVYIIRLDLERYPSLAWKYARREFEFEYVGEVVENEGPSQ